MNATVNAADVKKLLIAMKTRRDAAIAKIEELEARASVYGTTLADRRELDAAKTEVKTMEAEGRKLRAQYNV